MNKTMVYTLTALLSIAALAGCGRMENTIDKTRPTAYPAATMAPEIVTPDPEDGYVRDEDGIITEDDTGRVNGKETTRPSASPDTGMGMNSASPSPTPNTNGAA